MTAIARARRWSAPDLIVELGNWADASQPIYAQLADRIAALIDDGTVRDGELLPSERALASRLMLSRRTVEASYNQLRSSGRVASKQGIGTWCLPTGTPRRRQASPAAFVRQLLTSNTSALYMTVASLPAHPFVAEAGKAAERVVRAAANSHGYLPAGLDSLRQRVAGWFESYGVPTDPEQVSVTAGAAQALLLAGALLEPGATVWVESPTSPTVLSALRWHRLRLRSTPADRDGMGLPTPAGQAIFVTPAYLNPTGACLSDARSRGLALTSSTTATIVIEDLTLIDLRLDGPRPRPIAAHAPEGNVLSIGSMSKTYWAGMRLGWIRAPRHLMNALAHLKGLLDLGTAIDAQAQATWLLDRRDLVVADRVATVRRQRDGLAAALTSQLPGWDFDLPLGGLSLWVRLPGADAGDIVARGQRCGLALLSGSAFDVEGKDDHHLRLPFVQRPDVLVEAVRRLVTAARSGPGPTRPVAPEAMA